MTPKVLGPPTRGWGIGFLACCWEVETQPVASEGKVVPPPVCSPLHFLSLCQGNRERQPPVQKVPPGYLGDTGTRAVCSETLNLLLFMLFMVRVFDRFAGLYTV